MYIVLELTYITPLILLRTCTNFADRFDILRGKSKLITLNENRILLQFDRKFGGDPVRIDIIICVLNKLQDEMGLLRI